MHCRARSCASSPQRPAGLTGSRTCGQSSLEAVAAPFPQGPTSTGSAIHRLLQAHGLSRPSGAASEPEERRAYVAEYAGDIWYGDVMHGPRVPMEGKQRKAYLVSLMDDASRLIVHSAFCPGETALDIEAVLKQAVLKRGLPVKLVIEYVS